MVKMIPLVCPNCGAKLDIKDGTQTCFCTYCGTKILVNDSNIKTINKNINQNINIRKTVIDETESKKAEAEANNMKYYTILMVFLFSLLFLMWILG